MRRASACRRPSAAVIMDRIAAVGMPPLAPDNAAKGCRGFARRVNILCAAV
jgi:hypothetical protein